MVFVLSLFMLLLLPYNCIVLTWEIILQPILEEENEVHTSTLSSVCKAFYHISSTFIHKIIIQPEQKSALKMFERLEKWCQCTVEKEMESYFCTSDEIIAEEDREFQVDILDSLHEVK